MTQPYKISDFEDPMVEPASITRLREEMNRRISLVRKKVESRVIKVLNRHAVSPTESQEPHPTNQ